MCNDTYDNSAAETSIANSRPTAKTAAQQGHLLASPNNATQVKQSAKWYVLTASCASKLYILLQRGLEACWSSHITKSASRA